MNFLRQLGSLSAVFFGFWIVSVMAHSGVENEVVKARMMAMKEIGASMKYIGKVRRGSKTFDLQEIKEELESIRYNASITPKLFEVYAMDPLSEAGTEIWETFDDFKNKAVSLEKVAEKLLTTLENEGQLNDALMVLGSGCKSCHSKYRN